MIPVMRKNLCFLLVICSVHCFSQERMRASDSIPSMSEVIITGYESQRQLLETPAAVSVVTAKDMQRFANTTLVPALNSIPGVRMEERSPGSYRLSIRGSLLRSPFGIRNIKMYLDEYALTDAGGNTYLNLLDAGTLNSVTVFKGPEASAFGANTGGVVLIDPLKIRDSSFLSADVTAGSYGLFHQKASVKKQW